MFPDRVVSAVVKPGKKFHYYSEETAHITNIAVCLKTESNKKISSTIPPFVSVLKLVYEGPVQPSGKDFDEDEESSKKDAGEDDEDSQSGEFEEKEIVIGTFTPNTMQITTDLYLASTSQYQFVLSGSSEHEVHLHGRYIDEPYEDSFCDDEEDSDDDMDEPDSDDILEDDAKFEELADDNGEAAPKGKEISTGSSSSKKAPKKANVESESKKRALEDKETDADVSMADSTAASITEGGVKLSKAQRKKLKKARLSETNSAVPEAKESAPAKDTAPKAASAPTDSAPKTVTLPSGLKIVDSKIGTGADAKAGKTILMRYIGKLANGTVFDSNTQGKAFSFELGRGQVIKGWDEGIKGMKVGGERRLVIPANLAYGKSGSLPQIPPNSALTFDVKLLKIK